MPKKLLNVAHAAFNHYANCTHNAVLFLFLLFNLWDVIRKGYFKLNFCKKKFS